MKWLRSLFSSGGSRCTERGLAKAIGTKHFRQISNRCADRRFLFQMVADLQGITERDLLKQLAVRMDLRVAPRVVHTEFEHLPWDINITTMRRGGYIPIVREGIFHGVIGINPARVPIALSEREDFQFLLAPWKDISDAISASERRLESLQDKKDQAKRAQLVSSLNKVLAFLVDEVESHNQHQAKISLEGNAIFYLFETPDGRTAKGKISETLLEVLREFLDQASSKTTLQSGRTFNAEMIERGRYYGLQWDPIGVETPSLFDVKAQEQQVEKEEQVLQVAPEKEQGFEVPVLLIDDNDTFGAVVERFFDRKGIEVERVLCAKEALERLRSGAVRPRAILCDVHMPGMNGLQFVKALRAERTFDDIALVMLTSDEKTETELEVIRAGGEVYLRKSQDPRLICAHVERILEKHGDDLKVA